MFLGKAQFFTKVESEKSNQPHNLDELSDINNLPCEKSSYLSTNCAVSSEKLIQAETQNGFSNNSSNVEGSMLVEIAEAVVKETIIQKVPLNIEELYAVPCKSAQKNKKADISENISRVTIDELVDPLYDKCEETYEEVEQNKETKCYEKFETEGSSKAREDDKEECMPDLANTEADAMTASEAEHLLSTKYVLKKNHKISSFPKNPCILNISDSFFFCFTSLQAFLLYTYIKNKNRI